LFPVRDLNKALTTPHVNRMLILANVVIFVVMLLSDYGLIAGGLAEDIEGKFAMRPYYIVQGEKLYTLFTSMFLHARFLSGLLHIFGNMLYLYVFGDNVEDVFGHASYLVFYLVSGLAASFAHIMSITSFNPDDGVIGASGAIAGVLGAYLVLYPKAKVLTVIFLGWPIIVPVPAVMFLGFWFFMQWLYGFFDVSGGIAYWAHIGGFIAGMILALLFGRRRKQAREPRF